MEYQTSNSNPFIDTAHAVWGWEIPLYLFLGGLVAGMMVISGYFHVSGRWRQADCVCRQLALPSLLLLSLGMLALFLDLEHKAYFWRLYLTFQPTSPMSWGSWILLLVYPALLANLALHVPAGLVQRNPEWQTRSEALLARPSFVRCIGVANMGLGILLGIYTGILLSSLGARPLWNSAILGPLFLVSGLSTAAALVHMLAKNEWEREALAKVDTGLLGVELLFIALFFIGLSSAGHAHSEAAALLLGGPYTAPFWVFVVGIGIVVPMLIQPLAFSHRIQHTPVAPLLVLAGGLALRFVLVYAGQHSGYAPI